MLKLLLFGGGFFLLYRAFESKATRSPAASLPQIPAVGPRMGEWFDGSFETWEGDDVL